MPQLRAKFVVVRTEKHAYASNYSQTKVVLAPVRDGSVPDELRFAQATPQGELWMIVDNDSALAHFEPGRAFYLDFTAVGT